MSAKHPDEMVLSFNRRSIAHSEGKTLVIETVGLRDEMLACVQLPHSPSRVIERHRTKPDRPVDVIELGDPVYSKSFTFTSVFNCTSEEQIEYACEDTIA
ncbi:MAG: hypothetical protein M3N97_01855 [Pseudomonadota bacterium]|nr:hypothetical protein [Pseudomonadota bacterium]